MLPLSQTFCGDDFERAASKVATTHGYPRICRHSHCVCAGLHTSVFSYITPSAPYCFCRAYRDGARTSCRLSSVTADQREAGTWKLTVKVPVVFSLRIHLLLPTPVRSQTMRGGTMIVSGRVLPALVEPSPIASLRCHVFIPVSERHKGRPSRSERQTESDAECASVGPLMQLGTWSACYLL